MKEIFIIITTISMTYYVTGQGYVGLGTGIASNHSISASVTATAGVSINKFKLQTGYIAGLTQNIFPGSQMYIVAGRDIAANVSLFSGYGYTLISTDNDSRTFNVSNIIFIIEKQLSVKDFSAISIQLSGSTNRFLSASVVMKGIFVKRKH